METRYDYSLRLSLVLADFVILNLSYGCGYLAMRRWADPQLLSHFVLSQFLLFNLGWLACATVLRLYNKWTMASLESIFRQTSKTVIAHSLFFLFYLTYNKESHFALKFLPVCYGVMFCLFVVSRFFLTYITEALARKVRLDNKIAIVGHNQTGQQLAEYFIVNSNLYNFEGFFDEHANSLSVDHAGKIVSKIEQCIEFAAAHNIREIYSTILPGEYPHLSHLIEVADQHCVRVKFVPDFNQAMQHNFHIEFLDAIPIISLRTEPLQQDIEGRFKKRAFDIIFSMFVLVFILSWLGPLIALLIRLESRGPALFRQLRTGRDNSPFWCYKFRSMHLNRDSDSRQATRDDQRITRMGHFLRKTNLDELPQFFNVFMGDMSVVGPRPHMLKHTEQYSHLIRQYMARQFLKPGITGWAQVKGYRGETKSTELMAKRVEHDIWYMENWSNMLDIKIIFMTIINMMRGDQNAF